MWRQLHSILGLVALCLIFALAISGAVLATKPITERVQHGPIGAGLSVANLLQNIAQHNPGMEGERIKISPSGKASIGYYLDGRKSDGIFEPATGALIPDKKDSAFLVFMRDFHRSLFLGKVGRAISGLTSLAMSILCLSGTALLLRRMGGWKQLFKPIKGKTSARLHAGFGRALMVPLLIMGLSGVWLSGITFGLVSSGVNTPPNYPESAEELDYVAPWDLAALKDIPISQVSEIVFPIPGDWFDVWMVKTDSAYLFIDQFTGVLISKDPLPPANRIMAFIQLLHTAEGAAPWAVVLLISSLGVPVFSVTGVMVWWNRRTNGMGTIRNNVAAHKANLVILVGSENGATWGFAKALHAGMTRAGKRVHIGSINAMRRSYPEAEHLLVLASTYGDGDAPKNATKFAGRLQKSDLSNLHYAVLGFGDKAFPRFCHFSKQVDQALSAKGLHRFLDSYQIDKQSAQNFTYWCRNLGQAMGLDLAIRYEPPRPRLTRLSLGQRAAFGSADNGMTAILRFDGAKIPRHRAGDLAAIYLPQDPVPRYYSLGSSSRDDGFLEICVRRQEGGRCSTWLCDLPVGADVEMAVMSNDRFQPPNRRPVVMIGAGTGIAPFSGMIRHNQNRRAMHLFWGGRHPDLDPLYGAEITNWLADGRLEKFTPAYSRKNPTAYVQHRIEQAAPSIREKLLDGAVIMVCGRQAMGDAVRIEIDRLAAEIGLSLQELKRTNRYLEDVY